MAAKKKTYKFPKTMGPCADKLYLLRQKRLEMQKKVDEIEAEEKALKEYIINSLPKSEASGIAGKVARVTVVTKVVPQVTDYDKFYAFVKKKNAFELFQKRLSTSAIEERWENGEKIPGVGSFNATTISLNKL